MLLKSLCPCRGFSFRAYVQPIVQPGAVGSHWFMFEGVQSRRDFSFIAHEKKKKKKNRSRDLHNVGEVAPASFHRKVSGTSSVVPFRLDSFFFPLIFFFFLKIWMQFYETNNNEINGLNRRDHKLCRCLGENACRSQT